MKVRLAILTIIVYISSVCSAQDMVTDRPDQTESASIVPKLHFQLESGFDFTDANSLSDIKDVKSIQSLLRFGLTSALELRLGFSNETATLVSDPEGSVSNILNPGFKYRIFKGAGIIPDVAVMGSFLLPVKTDDADHFWSPEVRLAAQHDLLDVLSLGYNLALFWDNKNYDTQKFYSVTAGLNVIPKTCLFLEFFGENYKTLGNAGYIDFGFTYSIINNLHLDGYLGYGLNDNSNNMFWGVGFTVRLPK
ncbi:transporter [Saccharicrinis sp. FJH2]|uniref:transporter n=1 Tax=Saccharicrinis sp. FJH65 TaxID=3344659 RepID=UPI0035F41846